MTDTDATLRDWVGRMVVVDVAPPIVYIGRLAAADDHYYTLEDADLHDLGAANRSAYIHEARQLGHQPVRRVLKVRAAQVLSLSLLDDVVAY